MRIARLIPILLLPSIAGAQQPSAGNGLVPFRSEAELSRYLRTVAPPPASPTAPAPSCGSPLLKVTSGRMAAAGSRTAVLTGRVRRLSGEPLVAASVTAASLGLGATTDAEGGFTLMVPQEALSGRDSTTMSLAIRRIGFEPRTLTRAVRAGDSLHVEVELCEASVQLDAVATTALSASVADESITNTQHEGVDEGGIVKMHGDHLVILRRGRLFTVALGDRSMQPISEVDAFPPGIDGVGAWYDELLVHGDRVVVIGYSYASRGTELNLFRIDRAGRLAYDATYHLRSNDYYSSRNYASRLVDGKLVFYTPHYLGRYGGDPLASLPALRRWRGPADSSAPFERIVTPRRVYAAPRSASASGYTALHTVTTCDLAMVPIDCDATVVVGLPGREFYVSPTAVYVWTADWRRDGDERAEAVVYRMPLDGSRPGAVRAAGAPVDQFSFLEDSNHLNVVVEPSGGGGWMWSAERGRADLALVRIPLRAFGDGRESVPHGSYRRLPLAAHGPIVNRFVNARLLYGIRRWNAVDSGAVTVVPLDGGRITELALPHDVARIETMGTDALVVGEGRKALHLTAIRLAPEPRVGHAYQLADAQQGEARSHGFFYKADGPRRGTLGLPVRSDRSRPYAHLIEESASVLFLRNEGDAFHELGQLAARRTLVDDGCKASCADWYGNSRPLFIGGRVFALLGYELVEGAVRGGRLVETNRVLFVKERATAERLQQARDSVEIRRLVEREARWREAGAGDSVLQHYSTDLLLIAPDGQEIRYWNVVRDLRPGTRPAAARIEPVIEELTVNGGSAVMRVSWLTTTGAGEPAQRTLTREMRMWRRDADGRWRFVRGMQQAPTVLRQGQ